MKKIVNFLKGIFLIFLYFIIQLFVYALFYKDIYNTNNLLRNVSTIFADLLVLFIFIVIFRKKLIPDFNNFKKNYKELIKDNFKYWILGLIIMIISNVIISLFVGNMASNEELNRSILMELPVSSIISMVVVAPVIEELITRKTFKEVFKNKYVYILFSGFLFAALHIIASETLLETLFIIPYASLGCAFAKMYYDTDNLWTNIFFHAIHNLIAIIIIFVGV